MVSLRSTPPRTFIQYFPNLKHSTQPYTDLQKMLAEHRIGPGGIYYQRAVTVSTDPVQRVQVPVPSRPAGQGWQRVYYGNGSVAHLIDVDASPSDGATARCGLNKHGDFYWRGTGSQEEIDWLATLPTCRSCQNGLERDRAVAEYTRHLTPEGLYDKWV